MEPVTHVLTGTCLARSGLNRRAAYATAGMAIAAEFPDIDTLWGLRGPVSGFEHHRGITHTLIGLPFEAGVILLGFMLYHWIRHRTLRPSGTQAPVSKATGSAVAPLRWGKLYALLCLALLSHLVLDYTNNYGLRPFFPFNGRWYAGSIVFIFDPLIFVLLLAGLVLPALFGLIGREVGASRDRFRGRGWARAALAGVLILWSVRWVQHGKALVLAQAQSLRAPAASESALQPPASGAQDQTPADSAPAPEDRRPLLEAQRSLVNPDPLSVFRWYTVTDFGPAYQLGVADSRLGTLLTGQILNKPQSGPEIQAAERSHLGRVYLDWSPMPILSLSDGAPEGFESSAGDRAVAGHTVTFRDPRFMGDVRWLESRRSPPLTGQVVLDSKDQVLGEAMDGHFGR